MVGCDGQHEGRHATNVLGIHVGTGVQKEAHRFRAAAGDRKHQWAQLADGNRTMAHRRRYGRRGWRVHPDAASEQCLHDFDVAVGSSKH